MTRSNINSNSRVGDDDDINFGSIPDDASYFYIVDMDLTSRGEMCDEISHLSDPTTGGGAGTTAGGISRGGGSGIRRMMMIRRPQNIFKQPIVALRDRLLHTSTNNNIIINNDDDTGRQPRQQQQGQTGTIARRTMKHLYHHQHHVADGNNANDEEEQYLNEKFSSPIFDRKDNSKNERKKKKAGAADVSPLTMVGREGFVPTTVDCTQRHHQEDDGHHHPEDRSSSSRRLLYQQFLVEKENSPSSTNHHHSLNSNKKNLVVKSKKNYGSTHDAGGILRGINNTLTNTLTTHSTTGKEIATSSTGLLIQPPKYLSSSSSSSSSSQYQQLQQQQHHASSWDDSDKLLLFDDDDDCTITPKSNATDMVGGSSNNHNLLLGSLTTTITTTTMNMTASAIARNLDTTTTQRRIMDEVTMLSSSLMTNILSWWNPSCTQKNMYVPVDGSNILNHNTPDSARPSSPKPAWYTAMFQGHNHHSSSRLHINRTIDFVHNTLPNWILGHWRPFVLAMHVLLFVVVCFDQIVFSSASGTNLSSRPSIIDILYWSVVSVATIGGGGNSLKHFDDPHNDKISSQTTSRTLLICTMINAFLGVTSFAVVWGHYNRHLMGTVMMWQKRKDETRVDQVFNAFCNSKKSSSSSSRTKARIGQRSCTAAEQPSRQFKNEPKVPKPLILRIGKRLIVPVIVVILATILGSVSGWGWLESIYFATLSAFTLADSDIYPATAWSKLLAILMIPCCMALTGRWFLSVSEQINRGDRAIFSAAYDDPITTDEVSGLLQSAKMDDGLLTRADFMELMLLAMKKVDPELLLELRKGFERVTQYGSIDMTRKEWITEAAKALDSPFRFDQRKDENFSTFVTSLDQSPALQTISDWLLCIDRPTTDRGESMISRGNNSTSYATTIEV